MSGSKLAGLLAWATLQGFSLEKRLPTGEELFYAAGGADILGELDDIAKKKDIKKLVSYIPPKALFTAISWDDAISFIEEYLSTLSP